MSVEHGLTADE
jgi:magnesium-transporting ATPase (P-type)